ncbi:ABC transporter permease [Ornithinibacillus halotolerans]|nr:ABC transporter permease [Ornithinibacillus halotolerans]
MATLLFECKKYMKKRTTWAALFLSLIASIALYYFNVSVAEDIHRGNITKVENNIADFAGYVSELEVEIEKTEGGKNSEKVEEIAAEVDYFKERLNNYEVLKNLYVNESWNAILQKEIDSLTYLVENPDISSYSIEEQAISHFTIRASFEEKQLLMENEIVPFIQNDIHVGFLPTVYDNFTGNSLEQWESMTRRYGTTGLSFLYQLIQILYIPIVVLNGCFIFGNNISTETTNKKKGINFYLTLPNQKWKLFTAKYFSGLLLTLGYSVFMLLIPFLCGVITKGMGSLKYPVLVYEGSEPNPYGSEYNELNPMEDLFHFIELQDYLVKVLLFSVVFVIFLYSFYYFLSLLIKNPGVSLFLLGAITYAGMNFLQSPYNPFAYVDIHKVVTRETATLLFNPSIQLQTGMVVLLAASGLMVSLSFLKFRFSNISG